MFDSNHIMKAQEEQRRLALEDFKQTVSLLEFLKQEANRLGNDSGEVSKIEEIIEQFKADKIPKKEALEKANGILYSKEAGIDATSGGH
jgi:hypothetical protein